MRRLRLVVLPLLVALGVPGLAVARPSSLSPHLDATVDLGRAPATEKHRVVVGLELRNRDILEAFLVEVQDPTSPRYHAFLTQEEFNALHGPRPGEEAAVVALLEHAGLRVTDRFANRLVVGATGSVAALERAFGVEIHIVHFRGARHYAAVNEPILPPDLENVVTGIIGLDDLETARPSGRPVRGPYASLGSHCCAFGPGDVVSFYDDTSGFTGAGETIVIAGAYAWRDSDLSAFNSQFGLPALPAGSGQVCTGPSRSRGCKFSNQNSIEIALDAEYAHGAAPAARILNYMSASTALSDFTTMYNRIVSDHPGRVVSTSWGACEAGVSTATQTTDDNIFANGNAIGQSWFAASGDAGSRDCSGLLTVDNPANSPHVIGVGGTTPTCQSGMTPASPACGGYRSEVGWSGSGGGVSQVFARPAFQTGCGVPAGTKRLVPDVALAANSSPGYYVAEGGFWYVVGGTSAGAPQWAGFLAELLHKRGGAAIGNPGTLLYGLCGTSAYHDITSGSNGDYSAGTGYDLVTGLGTIEAKNFIALASPGGTSTTATTTTTSSTTTTTKSTTTTTSSTTSTSATAPPSSTTTTAPISTTTTTQPAGTCASPIVIPPQGGTLVGTTAGSSALTGCKSATSTAPEKVYRWTPAASGTATLSTCNAATTFDTVVYVRSASCAGTQLACNDDTAACATGDPCTSNRDHHGSLVTLAVTAGQTYLIVVDGFSGSCGGASGTFSLTVTPP